jgi:hypothetical protein
MRYSDQIGMKTELKPKIGVRPTEELTLHTALVIYLAQKNTTAAKEK